MTADAHIIFLFGNDEYAIAHRAEELAPKFKDKTEAEMNTSRLDAETMTDEELNNAVTALPFLAEQRFVLLANPSRRYVGRKVTARDRAPSEEQTNDQAASDSPPADKAQAEAQTQARTRLLELLERVPPTTKLVITEVVRLNSKAERDAAEKHWLLKWMRQHGMKVERHDLPPSQQMPRWITNYVKAQRAEFADPAAFKVVEITGPAAVKLAEMVGTDTRQAAQEITKLLTYVNWSRPIEAADVDAVSATTAEPDVFAMVDAMAKGNIGEAQRLLHRLFEAQEVYRTWGMILRQFRLLLLMREALDNRGGEAEAAKAMSAIGVNLPPTVMNSLLGQARRFTMGRLEAVYHTLLEIDEAGKTGGMPLDVGMDVFLAELPKV